MSRMAPEDVATKPRKKSEVLEFLCQLCGKRPRFVMVAGHAICAYCGDLLRTVAHDAGVHTVAFYAIRGLRK